MKILRIEVENLNSLVGEQPPVDLEGAFGDVPLFLILGPTGAGKSTLMDAVSLALFGVTPRFPAGAAEDPARDARGVMSRGAGVAKAVVEFSRRTDGRRYRATWHCRRAREKADGRLQAAQRTLEWRRPDGSWEQIVSDHRQGPVQEAFEEALSGLTIDDFKRSILLAQGEFAAFLEASEDDRAQLLERLTNTSIYSRLGARATARWQAATQEHRVAEGRLSGVNLMPEEEAQAKAQALAAAEEAAKRLQAELTRIREQLAWRREENGLAGKLAKALSDFEEIARVLAARGEDLARLAEHERCAEAGAALAAARQARAEHRDEAAKLPGLEATVDKAKDELAKLEQAATAAGEARDQAARGLEARLPEITRARDLHARLRAAADELAVATKDASDRAAESSKARANLDREAFLATAAKAALEAAVATAQALEQFRPLVTDVAGLRAREQELERLVQTHKKRAGEIAKDQKQLAAVEKELSGELARQQSLGQKVAGLEPEARAADTGLAAELGDATDVRARRLVLDAELRALDQRAVALRLAAKQLQERTTRDEQLTGLDRELAEFAKQESAAAAELVAAEEEHGRLVPDITARETAVRRLEIEVELAARRDALVDGSPCPLCGSVEHPLVGRHEEHDAAVAAQLGEARAALTRLVEEAGALDKRITTSRRRRDQAVDRVETQGKRRVTLAGELLALEDELAKQRRELGLPDDVTALDLADHERTRAERVQAVEAARGRLDGAEASASRAAKTLADAQASLGKVEATVEQLTARVQHARQTVAASRQQHEFDGAGLQTTRQELAATFAGHGVADLAEAQRRVADVTAADEALAKAREAAPAAETRRAEAAVALEAAVQEATASEKVRDERGRVADDLAKEAGKALDGADPEETEKKLRKDVETAAKEVERLQRQSGETRSELAKAETRLAAAQERVGKVEEVAQGKDSTLAGRLREVDLPDEAALAARLLDLAAVTELARLRTDLDGRSERARAVLTKCQSDAEAHQRRRPADLDDVRDGEPELRAREEDMDEARAAEDRKAGAFRQELDQHNKDRDLHARLARAKEEAARNAALWTRMQGLIGTNNGEAFRKFAQSLNLDILVERANQKLATIEPRYSLATTRDRRSADLAIRDAYQAGRERPIRSLSGGETFLVSLALALALASYRALSEPVETLLLDEGFGTLDSATLETAMHALSALAADGTQVGIISHVEALRERIDAQVIIEKLGGGRSRVRTVRVDGPG